MIWLVGLWECHDNLYHHFFVLVSALCAVWIADEKKYPEKWLNQFNSHVGQLRRLTSHQIHPILGLNNCWSVTFKFRLTMDHGRRTFVGIFSSKSCLNWNVVCYVNNRTIPVNDKYVNKSISTWFEFETCAKVPNEFH